jgi:hypothetical protein
MRSMSLLQMAGGVAVAGVVAAGSTALTGTGLSTSGSWASTQFVGGVVSQGITGATLDTVTYGFTDGTKTTINSVAIAFATAADGVNVAIAFTGGSGTAFTCTAVSSLASSCTGGTRTGAVTAIQITAS